MVRTVVLIVVCCGLWIKVLQLMMIMMLMMVVLGLLLGVKAELGQFGSGVLLKYGIFRIFHVVSCRVGKSDAFVEYDCCTCDSSLNKTPILFPTLNFLGRS